MSDKVKFIRLHDTEHDKICLFNVYSILAVYYDWDEDATMIDYIGDCTFSVRESVEEVENIIARANYL